MNRSELIRELEDNISQFTQARHALLGNGKRPYHRRGRRKLNAAAKKRISQEMKKVWAERKRRAKA